MGLAQETETSKVARGETVEITKIPYWRMVFDHAGLTYEVENFPYAGAGTEEDPYLVTWIPNDPRNPMLWSQTRKWFITMTVAMTTLAVALLSSAYTGGIVDIMKEFHISAELFGRQALFFGTYAVLTAFNAGAAGAQNAATLMILRFFAGAFGSSPLTNSGGVIADMFPASQRGLATSLFAAAPFLGPVLGPITGGFLGAAAGWRWVMGYLAAVSGVFWIIGGFLVPETYAPLLLRKRAARLSKKTGKVYVSKTEAEQGKVSIQRSFVTALSRPWILLFKEPIVLLLSLYMAIVYGVLYMLFAAFPIVYQQNRGWSQGIGGLAFLGIMVGMMFAIIYSIIDNKRYIRVETENNGFAPPNPAYPHPRGIHWMASIAAGVPFGFGMVLVFLSLMNYLIDSYTIFAASDLGIHWASSIPAFLALACIPFPFLFYKYGAQIRAKCVFAAQSAEFMKRLQAGAALAPRSKRRQQLRGDPLALPVPAQQQDDGPQEGVGRVEQEESFAGLRWKPVPDRQGEHPRRDV
ncbi:unnamed protein product [Parascedosporium putredinis]|uniref:Major facilitator superfamily (MFS) profile domain-containing protein n=1 Tax=Parascedosporium putredinis TaxID=1442378 RepID=A0A9P1GX13_9PEZI|nr:unnamed protein product [Parascedosporium putredinis]CAI7990124.1 unnamed protein product [Parascedosporium putredinis]